MSEGHYHCANCDNMETEQREVICWNCGKGEMVYKRKRPSMYTLEWLLTEARKTTKNFNGYWLPARPLVKPLRWRLKDAWHVLTGKADAFTWPEGQ